MTTEPLPPTTALLTAARRVLPTSLWAVGLAGFAGWFAFSAINVMRKVKLPLWERYRDFYEFYSGADAFNHGISPYLPSVGKIGYIYPPLLAFLIQPLTKLDLSIAGPIWLALNLIMLSAVVWLGSGEVMKRMGARVETWPRLLIALIATVLICDKLRSDLNMGQTQIQLILCWMLALRWMDKRPWLAGLALGYASNIKYVTLIAIPYFLIRRRWKAAAATIFCTVAWALLPAVQVGWDTNLSYLKQAFDGLILLVDPAAAPSDAARIMPLTGGLSCSITSMAVRLLGSDLPASVQRAGEGVARGVNATSAAVVLGIFLVLCAIVGLMYRHARTPILKPLPPPDEHTPPRAAIVGVEWAGLLVFILAFSPQTNMRHLSLLLPTAFCMAAFIVVPTRGVPKWPVILGAALLFFGLIFPPGGMFSTHATQWWRDGAGPIWCAIAGYLMLVGTALSFVRRSAAQPRLPSAP